MRALFFVDCIMAIKKQVALHYLFIEYYIGAEGGGRTRTVLLPQDFESCTSANSITSAYLYILTYFKVKIKKKFFNIFILLVINYKSSSAFRSISLAFSYLASLSLSLSVISLSLLKFILSSKSDSFTFLANGFALILSM